MADHSSSFGQEPKFLRWCERVEEAGAAIHKVEPLLLLSKPNGQLLFGVFDTDVRGPGSYHHMRYVMIRGDAVVVVPQVRCKQSGEEKFCMISQPRIGNGAVNLEFPAGMLDRDVSSPAEVAGRELFEETGLKVQTKELVALFERPLHTSVGLQDEAIYFYGCRLELDDAEFRALEGRLAGSVEEQEQITVRLVSRQQALEGCRSCQVLLALDLFDKAFADA
jgi:8-oxo-dGTP pyrophosphatase MutT (NUDIX family)